MLIPKTSYKVLTVASTGAGATSVNLRPAVGQAWKILYAEGFQDDGAVNHEWQFTDPVTAAGTLAARTAAAAYERLNIVTTPATGTYQPLTEPIWVTRERYLTYTFTASAGGKNGYIRALVEEYDGVVPEGY